MDQVLRCECGFEASGTDDEGLIAEIIRHAGAAHHMPLTRADALRLTRRAKQDNAKHQDPGENT
jgi:predicted small metal-binding protein